MEIILRITTIIVIQSLSENEEKTGESLYNDIIKRLAEKQELNSIFFDVYDEQDLNRTLYSIARDSSNGNFPLIHFELHGNQNGIQLANGACVSWEKVCNLCRIINEVVENELIVSLASCYGAYIARGVNIRMTSPFWGFIGPKEEITTEDVIEDFSSLFSEFLTSFSIDRALKNFDLMGSRYKYVYMPAQIFFDRYVGIYLNSHKFNKASSYKSFKSSTKEFYPNLNRAERNSKLKKNIYTLNFDKQIRLMRRRFLMGKIAR